MKNMVKIILVITVGLILTAQAMYISGKQKALNEMSDATKERFKAIEEFADNAEQALINYSKAPLITELLKDPDNKELAAKAQKYTEDYSQNIENNDGIYVSTLETRILAHTDISVVDVITRSDDTRRRALLEPMLEKGDSIYSAGIILSPKSYNQVLYMYKAVYNEKDEPIGFTGLSVKTDTLTAENKNLSINGVKNASFVMISAEDSKYIFAPDTEQIGKEVQVDEIRSLCNELSRNEAPVDGMLEYKTDSGKYISAYSYMPEYGWLLMTEGKA